MQGFKSVGSAQRFSQCKQQHKIPSTSNVILPQQERTEPSGHRPCRHGAKSSLRREPDVPGDLLRAIFGNVTEPSLPGGRYTLPAPDLHWLRSRQLRLAHHHPIFAGFYRRSMIVVCARSNPRSAIISTRISETELEPQIPAHAQDDNFPLEMATLEKFINALHKNARSLTAPLRAICPLSKICIRAQ